MIEEGESAPAFELPAVVEGDHRRLALSEHLGEDVVILAFFPGAFNPACDAESDLDQLDLFTMQPDVSVLAVGPDSVYANEAFAAEYDLAIPLLADTERTVAAAYGVDYEDDLGQQLIERAVFVIDHDGEVVYAWSSRTPDALADVDAIKDSLGDTGGDDTALSRYRVGHAHYLEARRAFTRALEEYADSDWMMAQSDFTRAREAFSEAEDLFTSAVRFVDDPLHERHYEAATEKSSALWQAADWLGRSANEFASGAGAAAEELREDAKRPLETARTWPEPRDPDDWPPAEPPERREPDGERLGDDGPAALDADVTGDDAGGARDRSGSEASVDGAGIDDAELAEIEAEVAASGPAEPLEEGAPAPADSVVEEPPGTGADDAGAGDPDADLRSGGGGSGALEADGDANAPGGNEPAEDTTEPLAEDASESPSLEDIPSEDELAEDATED